VLQRSSVAAGGGSDNQKPAPPEFPLELGGQPIGVPGATQLIEQCHAAQGDGEAHEELQNGFQHAQPLSFNQPRRSIQERSFQDAVAGAMLGSRQVCRWLQTIPCRP